MIVCKRRDTVVKEYTGDLPPLPVDTMGVTLRDCDLDDLSSLAGVQSLDSVDIIRSRIAGATAFTALYSDSRRGPRGINIKNSEIDDWSWMAHLNTLKYVSISGPSSITIDALMSSPNLNSLHLTGTSGLLKSLEPLVERGMFITVGRRVHLLADFGKPWRKQPEEPTP